MDSGYTGKGLVHFVLFGEDGTQPKIPKELFMERGLTVMLDRARKLDRLTDDNCALFRGENTYFDDG